MHRAASLLVALGCGCGGVVEGGGAMAPRDLGSDDVAASDAGGGCLGEFPCQVPQVCSCTGVCMAPGSCLKDCDCKNGLTCDPAKKSCVPGGGCGGQELVAEAVPPNLLVVIDRSCSMTEKVGNRSKWEIAVAALGTLTSGFKDKIRFGLTMFPDTDVDRCGQGKIPIPVAPGNEAKIAGLLKAALQMADVNYPKGPCVTNIDTAMQQATTEPAFGDPARSSYALLLTDGAQSACNLAGGDAGTTKIITDLFQKRKVATFVVGFGGAVDAAQLNVFAKAGGAPSGDPMTAFYKAEDQAGLDKVLAAIAARTLGCTLQLMKVPPDVNQIYVFFDNLTEILRDPQHKEGWDYDVATNRITFYGQACEKLRSGKVSDLDVVFGCREPTPG